MSGFVVIHRSLIGHPDFRNDAEAMAFAWMIMRASWKPVRVRYKGKAVSLERGQLCVSQRDMAAALDRDKAWVERLWKRLQTQGMIHCKREAAAMLITICNYAKYQGKKDKVEAAGEAMDEADVRQGRGTEQRREQLNKKQVIIEPKGSMPEKPKAKRAMSLPEGWQPELTDAVQSLVGQWPKGEFESQLANFKDHAAANGRTAKDWQAAFRTWVRNADKWRGSNDGRSNSGRGGSGRAPVDHRSGFERALDRRIEAAESADEQRQDEGVANYRLLPAPDNTTML